jgi:hypothetical protein
MNYLVAWAGFEPTTFGFVNPSPAEIHPVWLPLVNEVRTFLSTPSENYLILSMLDKISLLSA